MRPTKQNEADKKKMRPTDEAYKTKGGGPPTRKKKRPTDEADILKP